MQNLNLQARYRRSAPAREAPVKPNADYRATLQEIESLMGSGANTPEGECLGVLVALVEAYDKKYFPMEPSDPVDAMKTHTE